MTRVAPFMLAALILAAFALAGCGAEEPAPAEEAAAGPAAAPAPAEPETPAELAPEPQPEPEPLEPLAGAPCAVLVEPGRAHLFGVCTAEAIAEALAPEARLSAAPQRRPVECAVTASEGGEPAYEGCVDLSAEGLALLEEAARDAAPSPP